MGIHSSHALGIAWISASRGRFKKPLIFECFCFAIFFSILLEFTLSILGKMNSHSTQKNTGKTQIFYGFASILYNPHDEYDEEYLQNPKN